MCKSKKVLAMLLAALLLWLPCFQSAYAEENNVILIDNGQQGYSESGIWYSSSVAGYNGSGSRYAQAKGPYATWTPTLEAGLYRVSLYKIVHPYNAQSIQVDVVHSMGTDTVNLNGQTGTSGWVELGDFYFTQGTQGYVKMFASASGATRADAVKFERLEIQPTVNLVTPAALTDVSIYSDIGIEFNKPMDLNTLDADAVLLKEKISGSTIPCTFSVSDYKKVSMVPNERLLHATTYTVTVSEQVYDIEGMAVTGQRGWEFTTGLPSNLVKEYFVASNGSDNNPGTEASPFATLQRARDVIRNFNGNMEGDITVLIKQGTYELASTLVLSSNDSGTNGYRIVYRNYPGAQPVISGGAQITNWTADGALWKANVGSLNFRQLYVNGKRATRAQTSILRYGTGWNSQQNGIVVSQSNVGNIGNWSNQGDMEIHWPRGWRDTRLPVDTIVPITGTDTYNIILKQPYLDWARTSGAQDFAPNPDYGFYLENAFELLDTPGEWYLNRATGDLYYMPLPGEDMSTAQVIVPVLDQLVEIKGTLDSPVQNISFEGLTFAYGTWLRPSEEGISTLQADSVVTGTNQAGSQLQGMVIPGNLSIEAATHIAIRNSVIENMGAAGIALKKGASQVTLSGNIFRDIAAAAIIVGDMSDAYPADVRQVCKNNSITNNMIYHVAAEYWGSCGITAYFVNGLNISHNELWGLPYSGISVGWGWSVQKNSVTCGNNRIEANHVRNYGERLYDLGGIYTLGQQPGTQILRNLVHDSPNEVGIYLDAGSSYIHLEENITYGVKADLHNSGLNVGNTSTNNYWGVEPGDVDSDYSPVFSGNPPLPNQKPVDAGYPEVLAGEAGLEAAFVHRMNGLVPGPIQIVSADPSNSPVFVLDKNSSCYWENGQWGKSSIQGFDSKPSKYGFSLGATAGWNLTMEPGTYRVLYFKPVHANSDPNACIEISHASVVDTVYVNMTTGKSQLIEIGTYEFTGAGQESVEVIRTTNPANNSNGFIRTDSLVFERVPD